MKKIKTDYPTKIVDGKYSIVNIQNEPIIKYLSSEELA